MHCEGKIRWRSHNTSDCLIEVVTKACFTVYTFGQYISKVMFYVRLISSLSLYTIKLGTWCTKIHRFWMIDFSLHVTFLKKMFCLFGHSIVCCSTNCLHFAITRRPGFWWGPCCTHRFSFLGLFLSFLFSFCFVVVFILCVMFPMLPVYLSCERKLCVYMLSQ
jgi:hypothetical protein